MALTDKQALFVKEYLVDLNATQAYLRAGYQVSEKVASVNATRLLSNASVQAAIQAEMDKRAERTEITADMVLQRWWDIATADPNDIIHLRRVCCRHCWGTGYQFQWRDEQEFQAAFNSAKKRAEKMKKDTENMDEPPPLPSDAGGYGFDRLREPNKECPYCSGEGTPELHAEDTRKLSSKAKLLYAGIKQTQAGVEIKFQDQGKALENVARHLGMFVEKHEHTGKDGGPIELQGLTDDELDTKIQRLIQQNQRG